MKFSYIRPTKLHPEAEQRATLAGVSFDEEYLDEKPRRGEPNWYWWDKIVHACRPDCGDEIWVSEASVIADSVPIALKRIGDITARGATLVIASTGKRYFWHPDAAMAIELAMVMAAEARRLVAKIGGDAFAKKAAANREQAEKKLAEARRLWLDTSIEASEVYVRTGMSRNTLNKLFGPSGRPRFGRKDAS